MSDIEPWMQQLLADLLHGRAPANGLPVVIAVRIARDSPHGGQSWVRRLASAPTATDRACAAACHVLATEGEEPPVDVAKRLLGSQDCWARFHAALALRGPWAARAIDALERALDDVQVLSDMDEIYRVSDAAALALLSAPRVPGSEALRTWFFRVREELDSVDPATRDLATYALSQLRERDALAKLEQLAAGEHESQARELLRRLRAGEATSS